MWVEGGRWRQGGCRWCRTLLCSIQSSTGWWLLFEFALKKLPPVREALGLKYEGGGDGWEMESTVA